METKEQIAKKYVPCRCDEIYTSRGLTAPDCPYHSTDVESAMDEWSENEAISFAEWIRYEGVYNGIHKRWNYANHINITTAELYQLYVQDKNKTQR